MTDRRDYVPPMLITAIELERLQKAEAVLLAEVEHHRRALRKIAGSGLANWWSRSTAEIALAAAAGVVQGDPQ